MIVGNRGTGIDSDIISMMRGNTPASTIEKSTRANIHRWYSAAMKQDFDRRVGVAESSGFVVINKNQFPPFPEDWMPKGPQIIKAFIGDGLCQEEYLLRIIVFLKPNDALAWA